MNKIVDLDHLKVTAAATLSMIPLPATVEGWVKVGTAIGFFIYVWRKALAKERK